MLETFSLSLCYSLRVFVDLRFGEGGYPRRSRQTHQDPQQLYTDHKPLPPDRLWRSPHEYKGFTF